MHEDDSAGGESLIPPAGPSDGATTDSTAPAGPWGNVTASAGQRARSPSGARGLLVYLVVAALAAAAGVGTTLAVQHASSVRPSATRAPRDAAADQLGAMN